MDYTTIKSTGELKLTDYEKTHVRFLFNSNPYGLTATDLATAHANMQELATDMAAVSGLAVNGLEFAIDFSVSPDNNKPLANSHIEWLALIACEALMPSGTPKNRIMQIPMPHYAIFQNANELDLTNTALKAYARLFTELATSLGGSTATLRGGATLQHDVNDIPQMAATLRIHHPKL